MIDPLDPKLAKEFDKLRSVPNRDDEKAIKGRAIFLAESHRIQQTVSNSEMLRHKGWNHNKSWTTRIFRKETSPMFTTLVSAFLTIVLILELLLNRVIQTTFYIHLNCLVKIFALI
jgi:hypothetical protein